MENTETLLEGSTDMEKGAYIGAIASLATADRQATEEEIAYLKALCEGANLSDEQTQAVLKAAGEISNEDVKRCLDVLKNSDLRFSLITDLIAFAKADSNYSEQEQRHVQQMAQYLGVDQKQYSLLDNFAEHATNSKATPEQLQSPDFLSSIGLKDKLQSAGINGSGLLKGLLGIAGPLLLARMMSGGRNRGFGGGMFGNGGGMFGGGGGMLGGGGLGSLIGMLSGGRGMGSMGGVLGGIFGGRGGW
jgi:uncharacterized tellurite resistance protein B-like protein